LYLFVCFVRFCSKIEVCRWIFLDLTGFEHKVTKATKGEIQVLVILLDDDQIYLRAAGAAGVAGCHSLSDDLGHWPMVLRDDRLLTGGQVADQFLQSGLGFFHGDCRAISCPREEVVNGHRIVGHSGSFPGINSQLDVDSGLR
jgi:hypothetical protein